MKKLAYKAAIAAFFISGCSNSNQKCEYEETSFQASIQEINVQYVSNPTDTLFEVVLDFDNGRFKGKKVTMNELRDVKINAKIFYANKFAIGNVYTGVLSELKSGNCTPYYISFDQALRE